MKNLTNPNHLSSAPVQKEVHRKGWNEADAIIHTPNATPYGRSAKYDKKAISNSPKVINSASLQNDTLSSQKPIIPLFFATDDNYLPFLSVSLYSIKENSSNEYDYKIYILNTGIRPDYYKKIMDFSEKGFEIFFVDVAEKLTSISSLLHLRDYYTCTTYFRIFIAGMFPQYDKALYLDCDTVVVGDVSCLYSYDLKDNLIGGAPCEGVNSFEVYKNYVKEVDGLNPEMFFNAGVILMNLKAFREENFYEKFSDLLVKYKFTVIQDEDYLNVLCQDRVLQLPRAWNKFPVSKDALTEEELRLIHFGMTWKPWHYSDIPYQEIFWKYAEKTSFYSIIKNIFDHYSKENMETDKKCEGSLQELARHEIARPDGYFKVYGKKYGNI